MRAFRVLKTGVDPEVIEVDRPTPARGEISVRIFACGLNFADLLMLKGTYQDTPALPFSPGMEISGEVDALGDGVADLKVGQRIVAFTGHGGLAESVCVPAEACVPLPDKMDHITAAAFQVAYGTSHLALTRRAALVPGERLVVTGAAGGVGLTAVEIGAAMGAEVVAVARGADKLAIARKAGAHHVFDSETTDLKAELRTLGGVDLFYDPVGGAQFDAILRACNPEARLLSIGFASGDVPKVATNILLVKNLTLMGFYWGGYAKFNDAARRRSISELLELYEAGKLNPHVSHVLPLEAAAEGLELLRSRKSTGKVVIEVAR